MRIFLFPLYVFDPYLDKITEFIQPSLPDNYILLEIRAHFSFADLFYILRVKRR